MMIAEEYLTRSRLFRRLRNGPYGSYVELYASRLVKVGLNRHGTWRSLHLIADLLSWLARIGSTPTGLNERVVEEYLRHRSTEHCIQKGDRAALCRFEHAYQQRLVEVARLKRKLARWQAKLSARRGSQALL